MVEPAKPFACNMPECGMSFTNEDHLHVHTKKHDMVLQLGLEQKTAFVADQTPTPTRFIRNCEEVGLFQDLQNVAANPFDEGFKRAMEAKHGQICLESAMTPSDDVLHTPQMVYPLLDSGESSLYTTNQRHITMSRSSSDESGTIKELETRTISKLTNEVTTISRIVSTDDLGIKHTDIHKDIETVSYKNNVIKIQSNVIRKEDSKGPVLIYSDSVIKDISSNVNKEIDTNKLQVEKVPIMSQRSLDFVVDSLTKELDSTNVNVQNEKTKNDAVTKSDVQKHTPTLLKKYEKVIMKKQPKLLPKKVEIKTEPIEVDDYEVFIKLPNGKQVRMKPVDETPDPKKILRDAIIKKTIQEATKTKPATKKPVVLKKIKKTVPNVVKLTTGTLIPVTLVNQEGTPLSSDDLNNVPIAKINNVTEITTLNNVSKLNVPKIVNLNPVSTEITSVITTEPLLNTKVAPNIISVESIVPCQINVGVSQTESGVSKRKLTEKDENLTQSSVESETIVLDDEDEINTNSNGNNNNKRTKFELASRSAASKRYRERLKDAMNRIYEENKLLRAANEKLASEKALLKQIILEHFQNCPNGADLSVDVARKYVSQI